MISCIVIDDEKDIVESYSARFKSRGVSVLGIGYDGKEAVELYQKVNPDVVFLDVNMPKYDGFYAVDEIRKINPLAVILIISASIIPATLDKLKEKNLLVFTKPFDFDLLLSTADELVKKS